TRHRSDRCTVRSQPWPLDQTRSALPRPPRQPRRSSHRLSPAPRVLLAALPGAARALPQRFIGALLGTERTVPLIYRVLDEQPCDDLAAYVAMGGGEALDSARRVEPANVIDALKRSGLRGRGGAGFPTEAKWSSVRTN